MKPRSGSTHLLVVLASLSAGLLFLVASAHAGQTYGTKVHLSFDPRDEGDYFEGHLTSSNPTCVADRRVVIKRGDQKVGTTKTSRRGKFELEADGRVEGTYTAIAKAKRYEGFYCKKDEDSLTESHTG